MQLGSTLIYMDIVAEPRRHGSSIRSKKFIDVPPVDFDSLEGEKYRIEIEIASTVMPETSQNFLDLLKVDIMDGYVGTRLYRIEKNVGLCGGDVLTVLTNTGKTGQAAHGKPMTIDVERGTWNMIRCRCGTFPILLPCSYQKWEKSTVVSCCVQYATSASYRRYVSGLWKIDGAEFGDC